ncbi:hypothetical protein [Arthrobacter zhaoguopingii]|uniref:hypothetical protein n=1 Tax=Arthrobacter zhaoguopingii TaxID=2681491 RepID=UPI001357AA38|nr:hypothetical protein [Arthrobacter zhaoguopingii]
MSSIGAGELLVRSRREFSLTVHGLIAGGIHPDELSVDGELPRTAVAAWNQLEKDIPSLTALRDDLWIDLDDFQRQSTPTPGIFAPGSRMPCNGRSASPEAGEWGSTTASTSSPRPSGPCSSCCGGFPMWTSFS